jgi:hypothetical protein
VWHGFQALKGERAVDLVEYTHIRDHLDGFSLLEHGTKVVREGYRLEEELERVAKVVGGEGALGLAGRRF